MPYHFVHICDVSVHLLLNVAALRYRWIFLHFNWSIAEFYRKEDIGFKFLRWKADYTFLYGKSICSYLVEASFGHRNIEPWIGSDTHIAAMLSIRRIVLVAHSEAAEMVIRYRKFPKLSR